MGTCKSRIRGIPVYVSLNGRIVETHELFPLKPLLPRFNESYHLHFICYLPPNIIVRYQDMQIDHENTFKEGSHLQITFRPEYNQHPLSKCDAFEWYPDLHYISIRLITY